MQSWIVTQPQRICKAVHNKPHILQPEKDLSMQGPPERIHARLGWTGVTFQVGPVHANTARMHFERGYLDRSFSTSQFYAQITGSPCCSGLRCGLASQLPPNSFHPTGVILLQRDLACVQAQKVHQQCQEQTCLRRFPYWHRQLLVQYSPRKISLYPQTQLQATMRTPDSESSGRS